MGAGFEPSRGFSSLSSTAPSSSGVSMPVLGYGPTKPIQFAELETPFTWLTPGFAVLACYTHVCFYVDALAGLLLPPEQSLQPRGPWPRRAPGIRLSMPEGRVCPRVSLHVHRALSSHLTLVPSLSSGLCIYSWYGKWSEPSKIYSPGLKRAQADTTSLVFTTLHSGFHLRAWSSSCFTHFVQRLLSCTFPTNINSRIPLLSSCAVCFSAFLTFDPFSTWKQHFFFSPQSL